MAKNAEADIRSLVDDFVANLTSLIRTSAVESVQAALMGGAAPSAAPARRGRKPGPKPGPKPGKKAAAKRGGKRGRRTPEEIEADKAAILAHVKANPGTAMGDLTKALGMDAITIRAQVNDLLEEGALSKEGERRGTRYFAGSGRKKATKRGKRATKRGKKAAGRKAAKRGARKKTARK